MEQFRKPLWELPVGFNYSFELGREAFRNGREQDRNPHGESSAAGDWDRGWKHEEKNSKPN